MSQCVATQNPIFQPAMRLIASITQDEIAEITTTFAHNYITGTIVRLYIPNATGMVQLDRKVEKITVTGNMTFTIPVDTTKFDAFSIPGGVSRHIFTCAQVVPIGEDTGQLTAATQNVSPV